MPESPAPVRLILGADRPAALAAAVIETIAASQHQHVLVVVPDQRRADAAQLALIAQADRVAVTTSGALARSILEQTGRQLRVISAGEQRTLVARLSGEHNPRHIHELAGALNNMQLAFAGAEEVRTHADAGGTAAVSARWHRVAELSERYHVHLRAYDLVDRAGMMLEAATIMRTTKAVDQHWAAHPGLIAVDADQFDVPTQRLLTSLLGPSRPASTTVAFTGNPLSAGPGAAWLLRLNKQVGATVQPQPVTTEPEMSLIHAGHPAMEAHSVMGELRAAHDAGIAWGQMAVLCPGHRHQLRAVMHAAQQAGIVVQGGPPPRLDGPIVDAITAAMRAQSVRTHTDPADVVRGLLVELVPNLAQEVPGVVDIVLGLMRHSELFPGDIDGWLADLERAPVAPLPSAPPTADAVTLESIDEIGGRTWLHVVLIAAVEGALPTRRPTPLFDSAVLDGPSSPDLLRTKWLRLERARFAEAVASARQRFTVIAAPEPGVLLSRFVEALPIAPRRLPTRHPDPQRWPQGLPETTNPKAFHSGPSLHLSATQLTMFENCPWQYTLQYRLGLRGKGGLAARFGSLIHHILEQFLSPTSQLPQTLNALIDLAADTWTDDIADYRPQAEDYRQRLDTILRSWWHNEGERLVARHSVLAVEHEFTIEVDGHSLHGFIDRVDRMDGGIRVVDYKTGSKARSKAETQDDLQLAVYHLAASIDPALNQYGPVKALELNFIAAGASGTVRPQIISADHDQLTQTRIVALAARMLSEEHEPSVAANCEYCDLHRLCPLQPQGRPIPVVVRAPTTSRRRAGRSA